jgi:hypothetical protein
VIPRPDIAPLLKERYVALAADADDPEPEVHALCFKLKNAMMLPFVILADASGGFVAGSSGAQDPPRLRAMLEAPVLEKT